MKIEVTRIELDYIISGLRHDMIDCINKDVKKCIVCKRERKLFNKLQKLYDKYRMKGGR